ncbi:MAG: hypothetical protein MJE77_22685 [Proteobacteria bacterium]|nr:hypothetical protein [Pseudomonadota bacterium]
MATSDEAGVLFQALVFKMAALVADMTGVHELIQSSDAEIEDPTVRRIRQRTLLKEAAKQAWESTAREMLQEVLQDQGVKLDKFEMSVDDLYLMFEAGFRAVAGDKSAKKPAVLGPLPWHRVRGKKDSDIDIPPAPSEDISNYVLAYDDSLSEMIYVSSTADGDFGASWAWNGSRWRAQNRAPLQLPSARSQTFQGFYDPSRGGVACWTLVASDDHSHAFGILIDGDSATLIQQSGDIPTGPLDCSFDIGTIFGFDPVRRVTVAMGADAIWELDDTGEWLRVALVPARLPSQKWFSGNEGAVFDQKLGAVIFYWVDWEDVKYQLRSWDGNEIGQVELDGLPRRPFVKHGGVFCARRETMIWLGGSGQGVYRLADGLWDILDDSLVGALRDGALEGDAPPKYSGARAAFDPERRQFVLGPGRYDTRAGEGRRQVVFYVLDQGGWTRHGRRRVGTGSATAARLLAANTGGTYAVHADWSTHERRGGDVWIQVAPAVPDRPPPVALASNGSDPLWAVAAGGAVYRWSDSAWTSMGEASPIFGDWRAPCVCYDPENQQLVAWGGLRGSKRIDDTVIFSDGTWHRADDAGSPVAPLGVARRQEKPYSEVDYAILYDTFLGALTLYGDDEMATFADGRWSLERRARALPQIHGQQRIFVHDRDSGETLAVDLKDRRVYRCDLGGYTAVADLAGAGELVDLESPDASRSLQADWVFDPVNRQLVLYVDNELDEHYSLKLGEVFEHARGKGPRTPRQQWCDIDDNTLAEAVQAAACDLVETVPINDFEQITGLTAADVSKVELAKLADVGWAKKGPYAIGKVCLKRGLRLDENLLSWPRWREHFVEVFIAELEGRILDYVGPEGRTNADVPLPPLKWQVFGPDRPTETIAPPPPTYDGGYVLIYDETSRHLVYIRSHGKEWCERWYWTGSAWRRSHASAVELPGTEQQFCGVYDPLRGGVVLWSTHGGDDSHTAFGLVVSHTEARPLATRGDVPVLDQAERDRDHRMLFAFDRDRGVHVVITSRGIWHLDRDDVWIRWCTWEAGTSPLALHWAVPALADAAWDDMGHRVILWLVTRGQDGEQFEFFALSGEKLVELGTDGLPGELYQPARRAPIVGSCGERGVHVYFGAEPGMFRLTGDRAVPAGDAKWQQVAVGEEAPPRGCKAQIAYDPERDITMFGPGQYASAQGGTHYRQHVFFARSGDGAWQCHGVIQPRHQRPFHIEHVGTHGDRIVGFNRSFELFVWDDASAWSQEHGVMWTAWPEFPIFVVNDRAGHLVIVAHQGGVYELHGDEWRAREVDNREFGERMMNCLVAYDPDEDRYLAWHCDDIHERKHDTLELKDGKWRKLGPVDGSLSGIFRIPSTDELIEFGLIYDSFLRRFLRFDSDQIAVLDGDQWIGAAASLDQAGLDSPYRQAVHDRTSGETLIIDFGRQRIARFDLAEIHLLTSYDWPDGLVESDPSSGVLSFPFTSRCPYWPETRRLAVYDPDDHYGNYYLELGPVFDFARSLGPRTPFTSTRSVA